MPESSDVVTSIRPDDLQKLSDIFSSLGWRRDVEYEDLSDYSRLFDRFCEFLGFLNREEIDIVLKLTEEFQHYRYGYYPSLMKRALLQVPLSNIENCESIFVVPLIRPEDIGKSKSSSAILYSMVYTVMPEIPHFESVQYKAYQDPARFAKDHFDRSNALVMLLDDFVGSGHTAEKALTYFDNEIRNDTDTPIVISLVSQNEGVSRIKGLGFSVYSAVSRGKCISDSERFVDKEMARRIVRGIESRMNVTRKYRLGFRRSEALVSMMRAVNNTLPIYWWKEKPNGEKWNGLFNR